MIAPPPRVVRRLVIAPTVVVLAGLLVPTALMVWLIVGALLTWLMPGRHRILRAVWMAAFYLVWDAVTLVGLFLLWLIGGFGAAHRRPWYRRAHVEWARIMIDVLFWQVRWTLRLRVVVEVGVQAKLPQVPVIVLCRHAGPGDSFIVVDRLLHQAHRVPAIVLKDSMQWDPAIDVLLNRLPSAFVTPRSRRRPGALSAMDTIAKIAGEMRSDDALLLFPEGGNVTTKRRLNRIAELRAGGQHELAERAVAMEHVMAPVPGGFLAALKAAPADSAVLVVAHTGLEQLVTFADIWRELPMDKTIVLGAWLTRVSDLPADDAGREAWLFERWEAIDAWIAARQLVD